MDGFLKYVSSEIGNVARLVLTDQNEHNIERALTRLEYCKTHLTCIGTSLSLGLREDHRKVLSDLEVLRGVVAFTI